MYSIPIEYPWLCYAVSETMKGTGLPVELHQVAQHADDLDRAVAFYTDVLGCELIARFDPPGLAFLRLGDVRLLLDKRGAQRTGLPQGR